VSPATPPWVPPPSPCRASLTLSPRHGAMGLGREYGTIDDVDIDLHVNISFLDVSDRGAPTGTRDGDMHAPGVPKFPPPAGGPRGLCRTAALPWQEEVATAWKVLRTEPIVLRLRFSLSQYLDGPGERGQAGHGIPTRTRGGAGGGTRGSSRSLSPQNHPLRFSSRPTRRASAWVCS